MPNRADKGLFGSVDGWAVAIYLLLAAMGWVSIYSALYNEAHSSIFDLSQRYGMQLVWIGASLAAALVVLLMDGKFFHIWAYPAYWLLAAVLLAVALIGKEVNGARSWIMLGSVAVQPTELAKVATALALARFMSDRTAPLATLGGVVKVMCIIAVPMAVIVLQNDTGSALVYCSFLFMLYREAFRPWIYSLLALVVALFMGSFLLNETTLLVCVLLICFLTEAAASRQWRSRISFMAALGLAAMTIYFVGGSVVSRHIPFHVCLTAASLVAALALVVYALRRRIRSIFTSVLLFVGMLLYTNVIDYAFDHILQPHQQKRILDLLGIEADLRGWGYNVNQSKITIGSGGLFGKGFLGGTQTRYDFVPEQGTDFIFCTIGEERGFAGCLVVVSLFTALILRLMKMGERQREPFGRIYCYCVASILLAHLVINIGMTVGLMPVVGIPLPLFSYGGSSLIAFTILIFIAIKLDSNKREDLSL
ncbi:MAG: rod shape-determining protein RodA [Rikenellaceae bacterium]|jgi:rod shape determining protein RodA|nr:rod shape-determining protein RodA [Rikenellaceae bacterium]